MTTNCPVLQKLIISSPDQILHSSGDTADGATVTLSCQEGYQLPSGSATQEAKCVGGTWFPNPLPTTCTEIPAGLSQSDQIAIGGGVGGFVVLCVIIIVCVVCIKRRRRRRKQTKHSEDSRSWSDTHDERSHHTGTYSSFDPYRGPWNVNYDYHWNGMVPRPHLHPIPAAYGYQQPQPYGYPPTHTAAPYSAYRHVEPRPVFNYDYSFPPSNKPRPDWSNFGGQYRMPYNRDVNQVKVQYPAQEYVIRRM